MKLMKTFDEMFKNMNANKLIFYIKSFSNHQNTQKEKRGKNTKINKL